MAAEPKYFVGGTYVFKLTAQKDAVTWDLSTAVVTLTLIKPDGTQVVKTATLESGPLGITQYTTTTSDFDVEGDWRRYWKVVDGAISVPMGAYNFYVNAVR